MKSKKSDNHNFDWDTIELPEKEYLYVKASNIPNAGNGLFTAIQIEDGEIIAVFKGELLNAKEALIRATLHHDDYFMNLPSGKTLDCKNKNCFAKYANDASGSKSKFKNNALISMDERNRVVLVAKTAIEAGDEIFTAYGKAYWSTRKHRLTPDI
jgi:hypothetical protein